MAIASSLLSPTLAGITASDSSLSRYFYEQSRTSASSAGELRYYGDVWPRDMDGNPLVYVTDSTNTWYHRDTPGGQGYGTLAQEILDYLTSQSGFDIGDYDANQDGVLDELALWICHEKKQPYSGCVSLNGRNNQDDIGCETGVLWGGPQALSYFSPKQNRNVVVDMFYSGTHQFASTAGNINGNKYYVRTLAHEIGHHIMERGLDSHIRTVQYNSVPNLALSGRIPVPYGYTLMYGSPHKGVGGSIIMAAYERDRHGWLTAETLTGPSRTVTLGDLYTTARAAVLPIGTSGRKVYLENRQQIGYFDKLTYNPNHYNPPYFTRVGAGSEITGLLATVTTGGYTLDVLPPDNTLSNEVRYDIPDHMVVLPDFNNFNHFETDVYQPSTATQLTPWTVPNSSGYGDGRILTWAAIDEIRYTGAADSSMAFEYVQDFRARPVVRRDSYIDHNSSGQTIPGEVEVRDRATLDVRVGSGNSIHFAGGLSLGTSTRALLGGPGETIRISGELNVGWGSQTQFVVRSGATVILSAGIDVDVRAEKTITIEAGGTLRIEPGANVYLDEEAAIVAYGQLLAVGTAAAPIHFDGGADDSQGIILYGDNSRIEHATFDEAHRAIYVRSRDNVFRSLYIDVESVGIDSWYTLDGSRSSFVLDNALIENGTHGVRLQHSSGRISNTTIRKARLSGLYLHDALAYEFAFNRLHGNGGSTWRSGIEIFGSSYLSTEDYATGLGRNRITGNAKHEVHIAGSSRAFLGEDEGYYHYGARNHFADGHPGPNYHEDLIYNQSSNASTTWAQGNTWVDFSRCNEPDYPSFLSHFLTGPVDASRPQCVDQTGSSGAGSGVPSFQAAPGEEGPAVLASLALAQAAVAGAATKPEAAGQTDRLARLAPRITRLHAELQAQRVDLASTQRLHQLAALQQRDPTDALGLQATTDEIIASYAQTRSREGAPLPGSPGDPGIRSAEAAPALRSGEASRAAAVLHVATERQAGRYDEAVALIARYLPVASGADRQALLMHRAGLEARAARYDAALATLAEARRLEPPAADGEESAALALFDTAAEVLAEQKREHERDGRSEGLASAPAPVAEALTTVPTVDAFSVIAAPNPFTSSTTLRFALPEAADVRLAVYDALGREVAVLVSGWTEAGQHAARFDGGSLGASVYLYRLEAAGQTRTGSLVLAR